MIEEPASEGADPGQSDPIAQAVESYLEALRDGRKPGLEELLERYPDRADEIREILSAVALVEEAEKDGPARRVQAPAAAHHVPPPLRLGDYRIVREIGRGGMGVVHEAIQESLGRRVALKLLPLQATLDARSLERFRREARAVASLHHSSIVPVFAVGEADGVHYYAMQLIDGQPLDEVLREVRRLVAAPPAETPLELLATAGAAPGSSASAMELVQQPGVTSAACPVLAGADVAAGASLPRSSPSLLLGTSTTSGGSTRLQQYYRHAARWMLQASEAVGYAHEQGILHRDIKPSNLLLDREGRLWVTDFGLAKLATSEDLTLPGEVAGTICYMAPERFRGWSDVRSDVYSLGITLYELVTLRPAFRDSDRGRLLRRVTSGEPAAPRRVAPQIPRDLETIVLKAIEKEPGRRYHAAAELSRDLRAFLEDRPILARRASRVERVWRWCRRNPALAGTASIALVFLVGVLVTLIVARAARDGEREARYWRAFAEARARRESIAPGRKIESLAMVRQAAEQLRGLDLAAGELASRQLALRNEAIASLALDDLQPARSWRGNPQGTCELAFDAELRRYARGDAEGNISLRSVDPDSELASLRREGGRILRLRFSPDGQLLLAEHAAQGSAPGREARLWDLRRGEVVLEVRSLALARGLGGDAVDFSPDGARLAIGLASGAIAIHDVPSTRLRRELPRLEIDQLGQLRFRPDGGSLAIAGEHESPGGRTVLLRDAETGAILSRFEHPAPIHCLAWHPDGRRLAAGCADWRVRVTDVASGHVEVSEVAHTAERSMLYSHAGDLLVTASLDRRIRLRDPGTGEVRAWAFGVPHGHGLQLGRDDALLAYGVIGEDLTLWSVSRTRHYRSLPGPTEIGVGNIWGLDLAASPDGRLAASTHVDGVHLWDPHDPRELARLEVTEARGVFIPPSGDAVITVADPGAHRWPIRTATPSGRDGTGRIEAAREIGPPQPLGLSVRHLLGASALGLDGKTFVVCHGEHFHVLDLASGREGVLKDHHRGCRWLAVSPDGRWLASSAGLGSAPPGVKVWELESGDPVTTIAQPAGGQIGFSPDGRWLVTSEEREHRFFRVGTWEAARSIARAHHDHPGCIAFARDGEILARTPSAALVQLVQVESGDVIANLEAPLAGQVVAGLCFDPGGAYLAVINSNRLIQIWDLRGIREELRPLRLDWGEATPPAADPAARRPLSIHVIQGRFEPGSWAGYERELPECIRRMAESPGRAGGRRP